MEHSEAFSKIKKWSPGTGMVGTKAWRKKEDPDRYVSGSFCGFVIFDFQFFTSARHSKRL